MSDSLPPLPEFAPSLRPRWPGDIGGFTADQMHAYTAAAVAAAVDRCANVAARMTLRRRQVHAVANDQPLKDCEIAAAIRATET